MEAALNFVNMEAALNINYVFSDKKRVRVWKANLRVNAVSLYE